MSDAIISTGVLLKAGDGGAPEVFVTVAELVSVKPPGISRNEVEVPTHNAGRDDKLLGMLRRGQTTFTINWLPTDPTHASLIADILANTKRNWRITFPPSGLPHWTFPARVQIFDLQEMTPDTPMQAACAITIDGEITMVDS